VLELIPVSDTLSPLREEYPGRVGKWLDKDQPLDVLTEIVI
jgi:hypothetical protein